MIVPIVRATITTITTDEEVREPTHGHEDAPTTGPWWKSRKGLLTIASGVALVVAYGIGKAAPSIAPWAFVAAMLVGLVPIGRRAVMASLAGSPFTIEMLMTIAAVGAVIIGAGEEGATVVFLFLVGELLEGVAAGKARASIQGLTRLVPRTALVERDGQTEEMPADRVMVGAIVLVRPGERIPADGIIVSGDSAIDEAPVTGESTPVRKGVDAVCLCRNRQHGCRAAHSRHGGSGRQHDCARGAAGRGGAGKQGSNGAVY